MKIYSINMTTFTAKKSTTNITNSVKKESLFTKDKFYKQIEKFLDDKCSQEEYIKEFSKGIQSIIKQKSGADYSQIEKNYINNLSSALEMSDDISKIPDNYLKEKMQNLLKYRK